MVSVPFSREDVCMRKKIFSIPEALTFLLRQTPGPETVLSSLYEAVGCFAAHDVPSGVNVPPATLCTCDGFLLAHDAAPGTYRIKELFSPAGPPPSLPAKEETHRIEKGTEVPVQGRICPVDRACLVGTGRVRLDAAESGFKRTAGDCVKAGSVIVQAGEKITSFHAARLAASGIQYIDTVAYPKIPVITIGDEIRSGARPEVSGAFLNCFFKELGVASHLVPAVPDESDAINREVTRRLRGRLVVTCGGTGAGVTDRTMAAFRPRGIRIEAEGLHLHPAETTSFALGMNGACLFLPGSPEGVFAASHALLKPFFARRLGIRIDTWETAGALPLSEPWHGSSEKAYVLPAQYQQDSIKINSQAGGNTLFSGPYRVFLPSGTKKRKKGYILGKEGFFS